MNPYSNIADQKTAEQHPCFTSPWTEAFQAASNTQCDEDTAQDQSIETQPTLDALSDIYNRGYRT